MSLWLLDTNAVSVAIQRRSKQFDETIVRVGIANVRVSALSYGEICYGLEMKPEAVKLARNIDDFFSEIRIISWTEKTAEIYGRLRADLRRAGRSLSPLDMLIAAHALEAGATLVSNDGAFRHVPGLKVEDWTQ